MCLSVAGAVAKADVTEVADRTIDEPRYLLAVGVALTNGTNIQWASGQVVLRWAIAGILVGGAVRLQQVQCAAMSGTAAHIRPLHSVFCNPRQEMVRQLRPLRLTVALILQPTC